MKKLFLTSVLALLSSGSFAAATAVGDTTAAAAGGAQDVTTTNCTYLKETVKLAASKGVYVGYDCSDTAFGVAAGALKGKKVVYSIGSNGGAVTETAGTVPSSAGVLTAATSKKTAAGGGT